MKKKEYDLNYHRTKLKQIKFNLNKETDQDILLFLEKKKPLQTYLKSLIREQIKKEGCIKHPFEEKNHKPNSRLSFFKPYRFFDVVFF